MSDKTDTHGWGQSLGVNVFCVLYILMLKHGNKVYIPPNPLNTFRAKVAAKGSHAERFQSAVDRAVQEAMMAKHIKRASSPKPRSKGGRRTLKRGRKYSNKCGGRKSKKCGCSMFSFR